MAEANESLSAAAVGLEQYATGLTAGANSLAAGAKDLQDQTKDLSTDSIKQLSAALQSASVGAANVNKGDKPDDLQVLLNYRMRHPLSRQQQKE